MDKISQKAILEDIKSMCSEIIKMIDEKNEISTLTKDKIVQSANNIEDIFFSMIGEEKLSEYRNIKDGTSKEDSITIEDIVLEDIRTKDYVVRKVSSKNNAQDLKWHHNNDNIIIVAMKENDWKIQYDNQFPISLKNNVEYVIKKEQYYRFIKGTGDLYLKVYKLKTEALNNTEEIPGIGESIKYHIDNKISLNKSIFRTGSLAWNDLIKKTKKLHEKGRLRLNEYDKLILSTKI